MELLHRFENLKHHRNQKNNNKNMQLSELLDIAFYPFLIVSILPNWRCTSLEDSLSMQYNEHGQAMLALIYRHLWCRYTHTVELWSARTVNIIHMFIKIFHIHFFKLIFLIKSFYTITYWWTGVEHVAVKFPHKIK